MMQMVAKLLIEKQKNSTKGTCGDSEKVFTHGTATTKVITQLTRQEKQPHKITLQQEQKWFMVQVIIKRNEK